jgi:serine/threonine protein phosphatase 1
MSIRANVVPLLGNHEYAAHKILKQLSQVEFKDGGILKKPGSEIDFKRFAFEVKTWLDIGGKETLQGFMRLPEDERDFMLEYLENFSLFEIIKVNGIKYILTHIGLPKGATATNLNRFDAYDFVVSPVLCTGHLPTMNINEKYRGKIYRQNNHIAVDTGAAFGESMGCICLNTGEEFYV